MIDPRRQRLGELVKARRQELALSISKAARAAEIDRATWTGVEKASRDTEEYNYGPIERVLRWERGSVAAVLAGGDPVELPIPQGRRLPSVEDIPPDVRGRGDLREMLQWIRSQPWTDGERFEVASQLYEQVAQESDAERRASS